MRYQNEKYDNFEVIVVDDGSDDETSEYIKSITTPFRLEYIYQEHRGRAAARNTGIKISKNEIICFTDDDLILERDYIKNRLNYHNRTMCIVHGKIMELNKAKFFKDPTQGIFYDSVDLSDSVKKTLLKSLLSADMFKNNYEFEIKIAKKAKLTSMERLIRRVIDDGIAGMEWISFVGGNISLPREFLEDISGFDETFGLNWGCEDLELGYKMMKSGKIFVYAEDSVGYHISHYSANRLREHSINLKIFNDKYNDNRIVLFGKFVDGIITEKQLIEKVLLEIAE